MQQVVSDVSFRALIAAAPLPMLALDSAGMVLSWNPAAERLFGWTADEVLGMRVPVLIPEEFEQVRELFYRALRGESLIDVEVQHWTKDGRALPLSLSVAPLRNDEGEIIGVLCTYLDFAERNRQQTMRQNNADRLASIVQTQQEIAVGGLDVQSVLELVVTRVEELTRASSAVVELVDGDDMVYQAASGTAKAHIGLRLKRESSISGLCVRTGEILRCDDSETDPRVNRDACRKVGARSMLLAPLIHAGVTQGVLKVMSPKQHFFADEDVHTLTLLAGVIGASMSNAAAMEAERRLIEERTSTLEIVRESEERFRTLVEKAPIGVCVINKAGIFEQVNDAYASMLDYSARDLSGKHFSLIIPQDRVGAVTRLHRERARDEREMMDEFDMIRRDGARITVLTTTVPLPSGQNEGQRATFAIDITERKVAERTLAHDANHDDLTGLPNRRLLLDRLSLAIHTSQREEGTLAVLFIDLDGFKEVNDRLGHQQGDVLLQEVSRRLAHSVRASDTVARLAGDEFVLILPRLVHPINAETIAGKLLAEIERPVLLQGEPVQVGVSIGISLFPDHGRDAEDLLKRADEAMYRVKQGGKHNWALTPHTASPTA